MLGRVARSKISLLNGHDWEYFTGGDGMQNTVWSPKMKDAKPIMEGTRKFGMTGAVYLSSRRRYIMIGWYYPKGGGKMPDACYRTNWDFYESPSPWGPWTLVRTFESTPEGWYSPEICPKFQTENGVVVLTAGNWNNWDDYRLTLVPLEFTA